MARKRQLDKTKRVKAVARKRIGSPKPARILKESGQREQPKHKVDWRDEPES